MPIDPKAEKLLGKNEAAMLALRSYAAECWTTLNYEPGKTPRPVPVKYEYATLTAVKPNLMRYDSWTMTKNTSTGKLSKSGQIARLTFACNGKIFSKQFGDNYRSDKNIDPENLHTILEPWVGFYAKIDSEKSKLKEAGKERDSHVEVKILSPEMVEGVRCDVISYRYSVKYEGSSMNFEGRIFFGPDGLTRRKVETVHIDGKPGFTRDCILRKIRVNFPRPAAQVFEYAPPKGVKAKSEEPPKPVLANGRIAPDFTALAPDGKPVKLSDFQGKVVVIDFWATWCGPCMMAMPSTNKLARELKNRDVVVLGVNVWDEKKAFDDWVSEKKKELDAILFVRDPAGRDSSKGIASTLYGVSGIPTQFVIDRKGAVRASFVGFDEDEAPLRQAVEKALKS